MIWTFFYMISILVPLKKDPTLRRPMFHCFHGMREIVRYNPCYAYTIMLAYLLRHV